MIEEIGRIEYWSFDHQQTQYVNLTLLPGDRLNTHCVYDTRSKNSTTNFGVASTDEMCMHFLGYYPRVITPTGEIFPFCGYLSDNMTICGEFEPENILMYHNPTEYDPPGGANRTFGVTGPCLDLPTHSVRPPPSQPTIGPSPTGPTGPAERPTRAPKPTPTSQPSHGDAGALRASLAAAAFLCFVLFL